MLICRREFLSGEDNHRENALQVELGLRQLLLLLPVIVLFFVSDEDWDRLAVVVVNGDSCEVGEERGRSWVVSRCTPRLKHLDLIIIVSVLLFLLLIIGRLLSLTSEKKAVVGGIFVLATNLRLCRLRRAADDDDSLRRS